MKGKKPLHKSHMTAHTALRDCRPDTVGLSPLVREGLAGDCSRKLPLRGNVSQSPPSQTEQRCQSPAKSVPRWVASYLRACFVAHLANTLWLFDAIRFVQSSQIGQQRGSRRTYAEVS